MSNLLTFSLFVIATIGVIIFVVSRKRYPTAKESADFADKFVSVIESRHEIQRAEATIDLFQNPLS